jgi:hypothetical protein
MGQSVPFWRGNDAASAQSLSAVWLGAWDLISNAESTPASNSHFASVAAPKLGTMIKKFPTARLLSSKSLPMKLCRAKKPTLNQLRETLLLRI